MAQAVFIPVALERLQSHLAQGDRVVIATGCVYALALALLGRAGLGHVPLAASTLRPFLGGMVRSQHCFGPNKIPMLAALGFADCLPAPVRVRFLRETAMESYARYVACERTYKRMPILSRAIQQP